MLLKHRLFRVQALIIISFCSLGLGQELDFLQVQGLLEDIRTHLDGFDHSANLTISRSGGRDSVRVRYLQYFIHYPQQVDSILKQTLVIMVPPDKAAGQKYWSWRLPDGRKRFWIQMAASGKLREISRRTGRKREIFDFSELEISAEDIDQHNHSVQRWETLYGRELVVIKSATVVKRKSKHRRPGYKLLWIDPERLLVRKAEFYNSRQRLLKTITVESTEILLGGMELASQIRVKDQSQGRETLLSFTYLPGDAAPDPARFTPPLD